MSQNRHPSRFLSTCAFVALTAGLLQGCGSSGSSASAPPAATLSWSAQQTKTFHFTWSDVSGETEYRLMENPDGSSGYTRVATIAADSTSHNLVVSLPKRINAQYMLQSCNSTGCTDSNVVSINNQNNLIDGIGYFKSSTAVATGYFFGTSVALSADGSTMAVGAVGEDSAATGVDGDETDTTAGDSGAVYIFTNTNGSWSQTAYIKASNTGGGDEFGFSVALSEDGSVLAVGAYLEDEADNGVTNGSYTTNNDAGADRGAVYLFRNTGSGWVQDAYVKAVTSADNDQFGYSVALSADGTALAVGAPYQGGSGTAYLFSYDGSNWAADGAPLKAANADPDDYFGWNVALSGDGTVLAVSGHGEDSAASGVNDAVIGPSDNSLFASGAVYLFSNSGGWAQTDYIKASNPEGTTGNGDAFGFSIALSGDGTTLAVGAMGEDSNATGIGGDDTNNGSSSSGAVYLFSNSGSGWAQTDYVKASNTGVADRFGAAIALSADGATLAVGAYGEDSDATGIEGSGTDASGNDERGAVYLFINSGSGWNQQAYIKAPDTDVGDEFSRYGISLSSDGDILAIGAHLEDSNATGINGDYTDDTRTGAGAVYLY